MILRKLVQAAAYWGVTLAAEPVCRGHSAPSRLLYEQVVSRPSETLWIGPRGGGKSHISGLGTWLISRLHPGHGTRILGGSLAQSEQVYRALRSFDARRPGRSPLSACTRTRAVFRNGSEVAILAASPTSVRGPHVPSLKLDEVDEIDPEIRESAMGMCMAIGGHKPSVLMTSTWHRIGGPMTALVERGRAGEFPVHTLCVFDVLERCPDDRSGPRLENCPTCPLVSWCHADRDADPKGRPKAKRSRGHYSIDSLIQKTRVVSGRVFASDYLCDGPRADGLWFPAFDARNVSEAAEYDPALPVWLSVDSGVFTGAVLFQVRPVAGPDRRPTADWRVNVFADYLAEGLPAEAAALELLRLIPEGAARRVCTDSAGGARNPVGPTVLAEYQRVGLRGDKGLECWPKFAGCVTDGLGLVEALVRSADGTAWLTVHPRCRRLSDAFRGYARAKRAGQWQDYPEDPQHPHEDLMDALRGGLSLAVPEGRRPQPRVRRERAGRVF